jgi:tRNA(fMet)-specific endonuclease VapC
MTLYIFDTDHLSLYGRKLPALMERCRQHQVTLVTTVVNVEEQLRGRLGQVADGADDEVKRGLAYRWLADTNQLLSLFQILPYDDRAQLVFRDLKVQRVRTGPQDLRIGSIALAEGGVVLTRNRRDFERIPGLKVEDWSV